MVETTLTHECVHVLTESVLAGRPLWVREGLAAVLSGEFPDHSHDSGAEPARGDGPPIDGGRIGGLLSHDTSAVKPGRGSRCPSDTDLRDTTSPDTWRRAYAAAASCVSRALASGQRWQDLR
jgi:hypothetical protein